MRTVLKNISFNLFKNLRRNLTILLNMILCTFVIFILLQNYHFLLDRYNEFFPSGKIASHYHVEIADDDDSVHYASDRLNETPMFFVGQNVIETIEKESTLLVYSYGRGSTMSTGILNDADLSSFYEDEGMYTLKGDYVDTIFDFQLSMNAFEALHLNVSEGRLFEENDYLLDKNQVLPVILGSEFQSVFHLGDVIEYDDGEFSDRAIIVGFLQANSGYTEWNNYISLDKSIVSPVEFPRMYEDSGKYRRFSYIYSKDESVDVQAVVNAATTKNGFYTLEVSPSDGAMITETKTLSEKNVKLICFLAIISTILCVSSLGMILYHRAIEDISTNCICMVCGISLWKINLSIVIEMIIMILLSVIPSIAISYQIYHAILVPVWVLLLFSIIVTGVALIPTFIVNTKCNLDLFIRDKIVN